MSTCLCFVLKLLFIAIMWPSTFITTCIILKYKADLSTFFIGKRYRACHELQNIPAPNVVTVFLQWILGKHSCQLYLFIYLFKPNRNTHFVEFVKECYMEWSTCTHTFARTPTYTNTNVFRHTVYAVNTHIHNKSLSATSFLLSKIKQ